MLPPLSNVVGVTLASIDDKQKNFVRAVIRARRADQFMEENTAEAGDIVAKHYNIPLEVARSTVNNLIKSRTQGIACWGRLPDQLHGSRSHGESAAIGRRDRRQRQSRGDHRYELSSGGHPQGRPLACGPMRTMNVAVPVQKTTDVIIRGVTKVFGDPGRGRRARTSARSTSS